MNNANNQDQESVYKSGEVASILENINDGIKIVSEQYGDVVNGLGEVKDEVKIVKEKVENLETRFDGLETRFDGLENRFDGLENRFDGLENRFDGLETRFDGLESKFDKLQDDVTDIKYSLSEKVDRKEFEKLEKELSNWKELCYKIKEKFRMIEPAIKAGFLMKES